MRPFVPWLLALLTLTSQAGAPVSSLDAAAEGYVKLVLAVGQHDPDYVDAYYGPPEWKAEADRAGKRPLTELSRAAQRLRASLQGGPAPGEEAGRRSYLAGQLDSVLANCERLGGRRHSFDEEALALYQTKPPQYDRAHFEAKLAALGALLPGEGPVHERYQRYRQRFIVPDDKVDAVFQRAIAEARRRTLEHVGLPAGERFVVEYVTGKPWSGYNWYKGNGYSVIQVNTDLPIFIDRALDLAAHEGYPGHHVYNALLEQHLMRGKGWVEFAVYPLFSPQSLIAEGSANFGIEVAFPGEQRTRFEREVLFPLAGLDPAQAERFAEVRELAKALAFAGNEAARDYLDGRIDKGQAQEYLVRYALMTPQQAEQRVRFIETYRSYVINYNVGEALVREWVERQGGTAADPAARWRVFVDLLSSPRLPAALRP